MYVKSNKSFLIPSKDLLLTCSQRNIDSQSETPVLMLKVQIYVNDFDVCSTAGVRVSVRVRARVCVWLCKHTLSVTQSRRLFVKNLLSFIQKNWDCAAGFLGQC